MAAQNPEPLSNRKYTVTSPSPTLSVALPQQLRWQGGVYIAGAQGNADGEGLNQSLQRKTRSSSNLATGQADRDQTLIPKNSGARTKRKTGRSLILVDQMKMLTAKKQKADNAENNIGITPEDHLPPDFTEIKTKTYRMNPDKALSKKLIATGREIPYQLEKSGEGVNILCQAGLYELIRMAACCYYPNFKTAGLYATATVHKDKDRAVVQCTFKVRTDSGRVSYVLDLYHSNTTIRVSGRSYARFFDSDWFQLSDLVYDLCDSKGCDVQQINQLMRQCLEEANSMILLQKPEKNKSGRQSKKTNKKVTTTEVLALEELDEAGPRTPSRPLQAPTATDPETTSNLAQDSLTLVEDADSPPQGLQVANITPPGNAIHQEGPSGSPGPLQRDTPGMDEPNRPTQMRLGNLTEGQGYPLWKDPAQIGAQGLTSTQEREAGNPTTPRDSPWTEREEHRHHLPQNLRDPRGATPAIENSNKYVSPHRRECENCRNRYEERERLVRELEARERKLSSSERNLRQREKEWEKQQHQLQTQKAVIAGLERQVKELSATNRLLQQVNEAAGTFSQPQPTPRQEGNQGNSRSLREEPASQCPLREEIRALKEEMRMKELENRITSHLTTMESKITNQILHQTNQQQLLLLSQHRMSNPPSMGPPLGVSPVFQPWMPPSGHQERMHPPNLYRFGQPGSHTQPNGGYNAHARSGAQPNHEYHNQFKNKTQHWIHRNHIGAQEQVVERQTQERKQANPNTPSQEANRPMSGIPDGLQRASRSPDERPKTPTSASQPSMTIQAESPNPNSRWQKELQRLNPPSELNPQPTNLPDRE